MPRHRSFAPGFTLIELMITVAIAAVLMTVSAPGIRDTILNQRLASQANDLITDLAVTRTEAVKRASWTGLCPSDDGVSCKDTTSWDVGWIAFADDNTDGTPDRGVPILKRGMAFGNSNTLVASGAASKVVQFRSSGTMPVSAAGVTFLLCDSRKVARRITVASTGRAISEPLTAAQSGCP